MKRSELVFLTAVLTALLTGFLIERARPDDPGRLEDFSAPSEIEFEPLEIPEGSVRLAGRIEDPSGHPAAGVAVHVFEPRLEAGESLPLHWTNTDVRGQFAIDGLESGTYRVVLLAPGYPNTSFSFELPVAADVHWSLPDPLPLLDSLPGIRRADLDGRLYPPVGWAIEDYPVSGYEIVFRPAASESTLSGAIERHAIADAEGSFRVPNLVAAAYDVFVLPTWAVSGTWPRLDHVEFDHARDVSTPQSLWMRVRCGEVSGDLYDTGGRPIEGALVKIWPRKNPDRVWPPQGTDPQGHFRFRDLPAGEYLIEVRAGSASKVVETSVPVGRRVSVRFPALDTRDES